MHAMMKTRCVHFVLSKLKKDSESVQTASMGGAQQLHLDPWQERGAMAEQRADERQCRTHADCPSTQQLRLFCRASLSKNPKTPQKRLKHGLCRPCGDSCKHFGRRGHTAYSLSLALAFVRVRSAALWLRRACIIVHPPVLLGALLLKPISLHAPRRDQRVTNVHAHAPRPTTDPTPHVPPSLPQIRASRSTASVRSSATGPSHATSTPTARTRRRARRRRTSVRRGL